MRIRVHSIAKKKKQLLRPKNGKRIARVIKFNKIKIALLQKHHELTTSFDINIFAWAWVSYANDDPKTTNSDLVRKPHKIGYCTHSARKQKL